MAWTCRTSPSCITLMCLTLTHILFLHKSFMITIKSVQNKVNQRPCLHLCWTSRTHRCWRHGVPPFHHWQWLDPLWWHVALTALLFWNRISVAPSLGIPVALNFGTLVVPSLGTAAAQSLWTPMARGLWSSLESVLEILLVQSLVSLVATFFLSMWARRALVHILIWHYFFFLFLSITYVFNSYCFRNNRFYFPIAKARKWSFQEPVLFCLYFSYLIHEHAHTQTIHRGIYDLAFPWEVIFD